MARYRSCFETALAPWRTAKARATHAVARCACSLGLTVVLAAPRAQADMTLVPAEGGQLGAWLVAGPLPGTAVPSGTLRASPRLGEPLDGRSDAPRWRLLGTEAGVLDLEHALGVGQRVGARALVTGELRLEQALDGWLLLSVDGGVAVWVDGRQVWARDADRVRDRSWDAWRAELTSC
jgi:hypothetical protein